LEAFVKKAKIIFTVFGILLTGCATKPTLLYKQINVKDAKELLNGGIADSYYLNTSVLTILPVLSKDPNAPGITGYAANSNPVEFLDFKVGVVPVNNLFSSTKLNISKPENSDRFASGGTITTDNLTALISKVGGVLTKTLALNASSSTGGPKPSCAAYLKNNLSIPISSLLQSNSNQSIDYRFVSSDITTECIRIDIGPLPPDALEMEYYPWGIRTSNYFYSACRNAEITIKFPDGQSTVKSVRVADPRYFQSVQYPYDGSVTMHSECGVSVKTNNVANPLNGFDIFSELLKQFSAGNDGK
jgi:hypothetical protein